MALRPAKLRLDNLHPATLPLAARDAVKRLFSGPYALAFLPALALGAFWSGGEPALLAVALGLPLVVALAGGFRALPEPLLGARDPVTSLPLAAALGEAAEDAVARGDAAGLRTACFLLQVEDFTTLQSRHGSAAYESILRSAALRLRAVLRERDTLTWMGDGQFGVVLHAVPRLDLESCIQLAGRLQAALEEPHALNGVSVYPDCSVGFCLSSQGSSPGLTLGSSRGSSLGSSQGHIGAGNDLIGHAAIALDSARSQGNSAIRAYSDEMGQARRKHETLVDEAVAALEKGQIRPWFQPQISTDTGQVTGFEALARWAHPDRGMIPPGEFLPVLEHTGQMERLSEIILYGALNALTAWDAAGVQVPCVAVNFSGEELRNPHLPDRIRWDLDRFDLKADRLTVEILETVVVGSPEDLATRNITRLAEMGCRIDLDDFGTGNASIAAIRRFAIERIKIDRSFITHVDNDTEQQRMVSAILTMADRLDLETLAEGVETSGEHNMLAQLGCRHVQGFGIARPMPFEETVDWITRHTARLGPLPDIGRQSG